MAYIVGITGKIASGKSTVAKIIRDQKIPVLDADLYTHSCYSPGSESYNLVIKLFGVKILANGGFIDRKKLSALLLSDAEKLSKLCEIIWPATSDALLNSIQLLENINKFIFIEAAVLIEAGWEKYTDEIWLVDSSEEVAKQRLLTRPEEHKKILAQQKNQKFSSPKISTTIHNNETIDKLKEKVLKALNDLVKSK